jgi:ABC-2 type transport system permease protein
MIRRSHVTALLRKEWLELRTIWGAWLPGLLTVPVVALPFLFAIVLPALFNEPLEESDFADQLDRVGTVWPAVAHLPPRAAVQAFVFQQFLAAVVLVPVTGAMSLAAHSVIGEKQTRALEPLLATPLTSLELLLAKVLGSLLPSLALEAATVAIYLGLVGWAADPGVLPALLSWRTAVVILALGPLSTLVGLQLVVLASTTAKDPRSAQQVGVLVVLPLVAILVAPTMSAFWVTGGQLVVASLVLLALWVALLAGSARLFDGERILTRWR